MTGDTVGGARGAPRLGLPSRVLRVDRACDRFEAEWRAGQRPHLESYLDAAPEPERPALLRELLALELELRGGEPPRRDQDLPLDPEHTTRIESAFSLATPTPLDDTPAADILPGDACICMFGDYEILRELGRGGMGVVDMARQISLNRLVALKLIQGGLIASDDDLRRFRNEAEAVAALDHPGIVPIHESGQLNGFAYFSMKLASGGNLARRLPDFAADVRAAARLMIPVAEAVHHAHQRGILHRDLKPANILLDEPGRPYVSDFGLAKRIEVESGLTRASALLGTPSYMAPEQAEGRSAKVTTVTDVYGLGAIFYSVLAGRPPFDGGSILETLRQVREEDPISPARLNTRFDRDLETICLKCLQKDPARRYGSALAFSEDLRSYFAGKPIVARPVSPATKAWMGCRRKPALSAMALVLLMALTGGLAGILWNWQEAVRQRDLAEQRRQELEIDMALELRSIAQFQRAVLDHADLLQRPDLAALRADLLAIPRDYTGQFHRSVGARREPTPELLKRVAMSYMALAQMIRVLDSPSRAIWAYREAIAILEPLARRRSDVVPDRAMLARCYRELARVRPGGDRTGAEGPG
ncbi:MAG TPA: serine/threonine-protein kinase [Isosphaeraceae bacterium]